MTKTTRPPKTFFIVCLIAITMLFTTNIFAGGYTAIIGVVDLKVNVNTDYITNGSNNKITATTYSNGKIIRIELIEPRTTTKIVDFTSEIYIDKIVITDSRGNKTVYVK